MEAEKRDRETNSGILTLSRLLVTRKSLFFLSQFILE